MGQGAKSMCKTCLGEPYRSCYRYLQIVPCLCFHTNCGDWASSPFPLFFTHFVRISRHGGKEKQAVPGQQLATPAGSGPPCEHPQEQWGTWPCLYPPPVPSHRPRGTESRPKASARRRAGWRPRGWAVPAGPHLGGWDTPRAAGTPPCAQFPS